MNSLSIADLVEKIIRGDISVAECMWVIDRIFKPVVLKPQKSSWVRAAYGDNWFHPPTASHTEPEDQLLEDTPAGGVADETEDDQPDASADANGQQNDDQDATTAARGQEEGAARMPESDFIPEPYVDLWKAFSKPQPSGCVWEQGLKYVSSFADPTVRAKELSRYLKSTANRELDNLTGASRTVSRIVYERVKGSLHSEIFEMHGQEYFIRGLPLPETDPESDSDPDTEVETLIKDIPFPTPSGRSEDCPYRLPTSKQMAGILSKVMQNRGRVLTLPLAHKIVMLGYGLKDLRFAPLVKGRPGEQDPGGEPVGERDLPGQRRPDLAIKSDAILIARKIIAAIESKDGCPIDPAPGDRGEGRLGRLFLEYFIWEKQPVISGEFAGQEYVGEVYARISGYPLSTEHDRRTKHLLPLLRKIFVKCPEPVELAAQVLEHFREWYIHRKPEIVGWPSFINTEGSLSALNCP